MCGDNTLRREPLCVYCLSCSPFSLSPLLQVRATCLRLASYICETLTQASPRTFGTQRTIISPATPFPVMVPPNAYCGGKRLKHSGKFKPTWLGRT